MAIVTKIVVRGSNISRTNELIPASSANYGRRFTQNYRSKIIISNSLLFNVQALMVLATLIIRDIVVYETKIFCTLLYRCN